MKLFEGNSWPGISDRLRWGSSWCSQCGDNIGDLVTEEIVKKKKSLKKMDLLFFSIDENFEMLEFLATVICLR